MFRLSRHKLFYRAAFIAGCFMPLTFLRAAFNFQAVDIVFIGVYLFFARKRVSLFALGSLIILAMLSILAQNISDRGLRDYFETVGDLLQIALLLLIILPLFRSMDDEVHRGFFRGLVVVTAVLALLMLTEVLRLANWSFFEQMYLQQRWSIIRMEPNSTARVFFTAFAALFVIGDGRLLRGFVLKACLGLLLLAAGALTGSRTFYLALFGLGLALLWTWGLRAPSIAISVLRRYWLIMALGVVIGLAALSVPSVRVVVDETMAKAFGPGRTTFFSTALDGSTGLTQDSDSQRVFLLGRSVEVFFENFFLGTGLSMSIYGFNDYSRDVWTTTISVVPTVHNAFIGFVLDTGVFGLVLLIYLGVRLVELVGRCPRRELTVLLTVLAFDMTSTLQWTRMNWVPVIAFVTWAVYLVQQQRAAQPSHLVVEAAPAFESPAKA